MVLTRFSKKISTKNENCLLAPITILKIDVEDLSDTSLRKLKIKQSMQSLKNKL